MEDSMRKPKIVPLISLLGVLLIPVVGLANPFSSLKKSFNVKVQGTTTDSNSQPPPNQTPPPPTQQSPQNANPEPSHNQPSSAASQTRVSSGTTLGSPDIFGLRIG